jgi:hypothetical protein
VVAANVLLLLLGCLLPAPSLLCAPLFEWKGEGAVSTGLGRCSILIEDPGLAALNNPARAGEEKLLSIAITGAAPYSVPGLFQGSAWLAKGWSSTGAGAGFSLYGDGIYREERFAAGASWTLPPVSLGAQCSWNRVSIEGLGAQSFASGSFGFLWKDAHGVGLAFVLRDALRFGGGLESDLRPTGIASAAVGLPHSGASVYCEIRGTSRHPLSMSVGLEAKLIGSVSLRMGMGKNPSLFSIGLGVRTSPVHVDIGVEEHSALGQTRSASLTLFPSRF